jgi:uncharacterized protein (DUF2062 family)
MEPEVCRQRFKALGGVVVIPTYENQATITKVIDDVLQYSESVIVVNDGCLDDTPALLREYSGRIRVLTHPVNWGKGVALRNGLMAAQEMGFRYAITIDADNKHLASDIPVFVEEIEKTPGSLLIGERDFQADGRPYRNSFANKSSNYWFRFDTGIKLTDTQSGYRLYPLERIDFAYRRFTARYEYELEVLLYAAWSKIPVRNVPIHVYYPPQSIKVSHFRPFKDLMRIVTLDTLVFLYLIFWRWPKNFLLSLNKKNIKAFIQKNITQSHETNFQLCEAIALGVFLGILPIWGWQMVVALALAHLLKLNKVVTLVASNISIPPLIPFIIYLSYWLGCKVLDSPMTLDFKNVTVNSVGTVIGQYVVGGVLLGLISSLVISSICLLFFTLFRKPRKKAAKEMELSDN